MYFFKFPANKKNPTKIFLKIDDTQEMMNLRNKQHKTVLFSPLWHDILKLLINYLH